MISTISQKLALFALTFILAVGSMSAQPGTGDGNGRGEGGGNGKGEGRDHGNPPGASLERCFGSLELTERQQAAISALKERAANATAALRADIEALNARLRAARESGDREAVAAAMAAIAEKKEAIANIERAVQTEIMGVLTPEQAAALRDCMNSKPGDRGDRGGDKRQDCFAQLQLSREQMAQIKTIHEEFRAAHADEMQELRELHKLLREARRAGDEDAIARLRAAIEEKMAEHKAAQARLHAAVLGVLTPEQLARLEACNEGRGDRDGGRRPGRGGEIELNAPQLD